MVVFVTCGILTSWSFCGFPFLGRATEGLRLINGAEDAEETRLSIGTMRNVRGLILPFKSRPLIRPLYGVLRVLTLRDPLKSWRSSSESVPRTLECMSPSFPIRFVVCSRMWTWLYLNGEGGRLMTILRHSSACRK